MSSEPSASGRPPVRVALIGYGLGGSAFHAPLIATTAGLLLQAVVTSSPERQAEVRSRYPQARLVGSVDELLRNADGFDLAVVTVPNAAHVGVTEAVLEAGLNAVVDKPVAPASAEAEGMADLASRQGLSLIPFHNRRWDGDFLTVRGLRESGRLGRVYRFESRFERWRPNPPATGSWKQDAALPGAGILFDLGPHLVDQALSLFGPPSAVYAEIAARRGGPDDDDFVALTYADGTVAHLWVSSQAGSLGPRFRVLGSEGAYVKFGMDPQEEALRAGRSPTEERWGSEPEAAWGRLGAGEHSQPFPTRPGDYPAFYAGVAAHLLDGGPVPVDFADAIAGLRILEAAIRSARSGAVISV